MQFIYEILSFNRILTVSLLAWFVAQVLKTLINFILLGKFQLERMWGDGGMPSAHSATVCAMVIATARCEGVDSAIFAVACVNAAAGFNIRGTPHLQEAFYAHFLTLTIPCLRK